MTPAARVAAAIVVLDDIAGGCTAEQALSGWARNSRFAGSKDRAALRDLVFDAQRKRGSCAALGGAPHGRGLMIGLGVQSGWDMPALFSGEGHAPAPLTPDEQAVVANPPALQPWEHHDVPSWIWDHLSKVHGAAKAGEIAMALRARAPLYLRVNTHKGTAEAAATLLANEGIETAAHPDVAGCLQVTTNPRRVKNAAAYADGVVEIQDAASQMAVARLGVPAGARVLDYCAGGGGKALAIADRFACDVAAHDIAPGRMRDIAPRAARAGVDIAVLTPQDLIDAREFDVVVVDAPCSGSGTWRRNPEAKWALTPEALDEFHALQSEVIAQAARHVGPCGMLAYMTCSIFEAENAQVVQGFVQHHPTWTADPAMTLWPGPQSDGFFLQILRPTSG